MQEVLQFFRGIGGLIVLLIAGYFVGTALFTIRLEDDTHNFIFKIIIAFILLAILAGIVGIIIELANA